AEVPAFLSNLARRFSALSSCAMYCAVCASSLTTSFARSVISRNLLRRTFSSPSSRFSFFWCDGRRYRLHHPEKVLLSLLLPLRRVPDQELLQTDHRAWSCASSSNLSGQNRDVHVVAPRPPWFGLPVPLPAEIRSLRHRSFHLV